MKKIHAEQNQISLIVWSFLFWGLWIPVSGQTLERKRRLIAIASQSRQSLCQPFRFWRNVRQGLSGFTARLFGTNRWLFARLAGNIREGPD